MLDPNQRKLTQDILDWLDRPAFTVEYGPGDSYRYVSCNTAYAALTEMSVDALAGQALSAGFALGEAEKVRALLDSTRKEGRRQIGNTLIRWANGWLCQGLTVAPLNDGAGRVAGLMVIAEASTPEKMHQVALQVAEYKLRDFAELASDWFWETDADHRFTWISDSSSAHTSSLRATMLGRCRWEVAIQGDSETDMLFWQEHRRQLDNHEPFRGFRYCSLLTGNEIWIEINGKPVFDANGRFMGYRGSGRDITEQYRQQRRIESALRQAEEASRAKSQFLANMSHELRTPLNAIIGFSEVIRNEMFGPVGTAKYLEYAADIHRSGQHLLEIINDILDLSKLEAGKFDLSETEISPSRLVDDCLFLVRDRAAAAGLKLTVAIPDGMPALRADERALKQIVINLLSNAVKFTPRGGSVTIRGGISEDGCCEISVTDTGIGMHETEIEVALTPFGQIDSAMARNHQGTGIGLPLAQSLARLHGGNITVRSAPGLGTCITVSLPVNRIIRL